MVRLTIIDATRASNGHVLSLLAQIKAEFKEAIDQRNCQIVSYCLRIFASPHNETIFGFCMQCHFDNVLLFLISVNTRKAFIIGKLPPGIFLFAYIGKLMALYST